MSLEGFALLAALKSGGCLRGRLFPSAFCPVSLVAKKPLVTQAAHQQECCGSAGHQPQQR